MNSQTEPWVMEDGTTGEHLPGDTNHGTTTTTKLPSPSVGGFSGIFNLAARRPMASLRRMWTNYYPREAFGEGVIMPGSPLSFIIGGLLSFIEIKSQGQPKFPFQTHPHAIKVAITSLLMYGLASGAEHFISAAPPGPNSFYAIIARWGKMVFVYMLVVSLASLFYF